MFLYLCKNQVKLIDGKYALDAILATPQRIHN